MFKKIIFIVAILLVVGIISNIYSITSVFGLNKGSNKSTEIIDVDGAETVAIDLDMSVGKLHVQGGADALLVGDFDMNKKIGELKTKYKVSNGHGTLHVNQKKKSSLFNINFFNFNGNNNEWDIQLNNEIPMELCIKTGVGDSTLDLQDLMLTDLTIETGVGDTNIDLSGHWKDDFTVKIDTGVGDTEVILPKDVGVILEANHGIGKLDIDGFVKENGSYKNKAYDNSDVKITVKLDTGIGSVTVTESK